MERHRDCPYYGSLHFLQCAWYLLKLSKTLSSSQARQWSYLSVLAMLCIPTASVFFRVLCTPEQVVIKKVHLLPRSRRLRSVGHISPPSPQEALCV